MDIVSISLDNQTLNELNSVQKRLGFKSRSKLIRATIGSLLNEYKVLDSIQGHCDAVFTITYKTHDKSCLSDVLKRFEHIISTEIHQHHENMCLRILITCGDAKQIKELFSYIKREKGIGSVQISIL